MLKNAADVADNERRYGKAISSEQLIMDERLVKRCNKSIVINNTDGCNIKGVIFNVYVFISVF